MSGIHGEKYKKSRVHKLLWVSLCVGYNVILLLAGRTYYGTTETPVTSLLLKMYILLFFPKELTNRKCRLTSQYPWWKNKTVAVTHQEF